MGVLAGGTLVRVVGVRFDTSVPLYARVGTTALVRASVLSPTLAEVLTPSQTQPGLLALEVSQNGQDFTSDEVLFEYQADVRVDDVSPSRGPSSGGTAAVVRGAGFSRHSAMLSYTLVRFNTQNDDIDVVKAKLDTNRELRIWLMQHGVKIAALPTLVLVRDGKPVRTLFGARDIMSEDKLHAFAFDESDEPPVTKPAFDPSAVFSAISSKMSKMRLAF